MNPSLEISNLSLLLSTSLLILAIFVDYKEQLGLGKDIIIAGIRAVVQLFLIGYILGYVFQLNYDWLTLIMVLFIVFNASYNAHKNAGQIDHSFRTSFIAIASGTAIALIIFVLSHTIKWTPNQIVPVTGMIASNAMTAIGVTYRSLSSQFNDKRQQVLEKLTLGATPKQSAMNIVRESIQTGMSPSISRTKTVGLVSLPGMMSGLMFAGIDPVQAIRYQIVIMFMLISVTAISSFIASYLAYQSFYNKLDQLTI
ncbi:ABC transporter permease [Atopobacter phocae]|uniref:ABC transporter permease n=1 Tax=Atopobacter phocae TaxID=136492 RepID=UPI000470488C|nr:iron export ABC transporter permease subunit FetB [Atopobacter phocae]